MTDDHAHDIMRGLLRMKQPSERGGPRVSVDTILLADFVRAAPSARVIEMGCAHGAISLIYSLRRSALNKGRELPKVEAFDISPDLIALADENAQINGLSDTVAFSTLDLRDVKSRYRAGSFDAAIMNPPYDDPASSRPSPSPALAMAMHGTECTLGDVACAAKYLLKNGGRFFCVMRSKRINELFFELTSHDLRPKRMRTVHPSPSAEASVVLVQAVRSAGEGVVVEPPLFIKGDDGADTPELLAAYELGGSAGCRS